MFSRKPHHFKHEGTINKVYKNGQNNITVRQNGTKKLLINYQNTFRTLNVTNILVLGQFSAYLIMLLGPVPRKKVTLKI